MTNTAKDVVGREIKIGSTVAYCMAGTSQTMRTSKVTKISPKMVTLDTVRTQWGNPLTRHHSAVCVVLYPEDIQ